MNEYIGHDSQLCSVEEHILVGGKGDGMRLLEVNNKSGLQMTLSPDRCMDITRLRCKGINLSYFSPCGYVAPAYYTAKGAEFLKSFTAGYLTTCGLESVGSPCVDMGEELSLHGSIGNTPAEHWYWTEDEDSFNVFATVKDEGIFARKFLFTRQIKISKTENTFDIIDTIENTSAKEQPFELLYHMNMGYPLLDEDSVVTIPSEKVVPRDDHAANDIENWMNMQKPDPDYQERCYYHSFKDENGKASIYQPKLGIGLEISFNAKELDGFVEWKMMGVREYVLGLECGNCYADGRDVMRKNGMLKFLKAGEKKTYKVTVKIFEK